MGAVAFMGKGVDDPGQVPRPVGGKKRGRFVTTIEIIILIVLFLLLLIIISLPVTVIIKKDDIADDLTDSILKSINKKDDKIINAMTDLADQTINNIITTNEFKRKISNLLKSAFEQNFPGMTVDSNKLVSSIPGITPIQTTSMPQENDESFPPDTDNSIPSNPMQAPDIRF